VPLAQRTDEIDWNAIELKAYKADAKTCKGLVFKPGNSKIEVVER
jgi:alpha-D-xyloside xylohydrolase